MELRMMHLPAGIYYGLFTQEDLDRYAAIGKELQEELTNRSSFIRTGVHDWGSSGGPSLREAQLINEQREIEQRAIQRVTDTRNRG